MDEKDTKTKINECKDVKIIDIKILLNSSDIECLKSQMCEVISFYRNKSHFLEFKGLTFVPTEIADEPNDNINIIAKYGDYSRQITCESIIKKRKSMKDTLENLNKITNFIIDQFANVLNRFIAGSDKFKNIYKRYEDSKLTITRNVYIVQTFTQSQDFADPCSEFIFKQPLKEIFDNIILFNIVKEELSGIKKEISANISSLASMFNDNVLSYGFRCYNFDKQYTDYRKFKTFIIWAILSSIISYNHLWTDEVSTNVYITGIHLVITYMLNTMMTIIPYNITPGGCVWRFLNVLGFTPTYLINNQVYSSLRPIYENVPSYKNEYLIKLFCCCMKNRID